MKKKKQISLEQKKYYERCFMWAVLVIIVNAISVAFKGIVILQVLALVVTVYALYRMVVYENKNNRNSRKYYDWAGRPLSQDKSNK